MMWLGEDAVALCLLLGWWGLAWEREETMALLFHHFLQTISYTILDDCGLLFGVGLLG